MFGAIAPEAAGPEARLLLDGSLLGPADSEGALLQAYARERGECLARLDGNFAACVTDPGLPGAVIGADAAGTRPLYYAARNGAIVFGSHAREVLRASGGRVVAHPPALARFLLEGAVAGAGETLFAGVREVRAGTFVEASNGEPARILPAGGVPDRGPEPARPLEVRARELRELLFEAVKGFSAGRRTGLPLSGGIDSSGIGAALRACHAGDLAAFCFVHEPGELPGSIDERPWARLAASHLRATLREVRLEASTVPAVLQRVAHAHDFPFGSPVVLAQSEVFRIAAEEGVETLLSGHGPDYFLGGGDSHVRERAIGLMRAARVGALWRYLRAAPPYAGTTTRRLLGDALRQAARVRPTADAAGIGLRAPWFRERGVDLDQAPPPEPGEPMRALIRGQLRTRLPSALAWEAGNSAAAGVDVRYPYLTASMLRFGAALPDEQLVTDLGQTRPVLRLALRGLVPDAILDRPHPVGFAVPALPWLRSNPGWVEERTRALAELPFCDGPALLKLREQSARDGAGAWKAAFILWRWISLHEWSRVHGVAFD